MFSNLADDTEALGYTLVIIKVSKIENRAWHVLCCFSLLQTWATVLPPLSIVDCNIYVSLVSLINRLCRIKRQTLLLVKMYYGGKFYRINNDVWNSFDQCWINARSILIGQNCDEYGVMTNHETEHVDYIELLARIISRQLQLHLIANFSVGLCWWTLEVWTGLDVSLSNFTVKCWVVVNLKHQGLKWNPERDIWLPQVFWELFFWLLLQCLRFDMFWLHDNVDWLAMPMDDIKFLFWIDGSLDWRLMNWFIILIREWT